MAAEDKKQEETDAANDVTKRKDMSDFYRNQYRVDSKGAGAGAVAGAGAGEADADPGGRVAAREADAGAGAAEENSRGGGVGVEGGSTDGSGGRSDHGGGGGGDDFKRPAKRPKKGRPSGPPPGKIPQKDEPVSTGKQRHQYRAHVSTPSVAPSHFKDGVLVYLKMRKCGHVCKRRLNSGAKAMWCEHWRIEEVVALGAMHFFALHLTWLSFIQPRYSDAARPYLHPCARHRIPKSTPERHPILLCLMRRHGTWRGSMLGQGNGSCPRWMIKLCTYSVDYSGACVLTSKIIEVVTE